LKIFTAFTKKKKRENFEREPENFIGQELFYFFLEKDNLYQIDPRTLLNIIKIPHLLNINAIGASHLCTYDNRFFVTGDYSHSRKFTYEFDSCKEKFIKRANMITPRSRHAFIQLKDDIMLALGGSTDKCEAYSIGLDKWRGISSFNKIKEGTRTTALIYNKNIFYVFAFSSFRLGEKKRSEFERIRLDENLKGKWELVPYISPVQRDLLIPEFCQGLIQLSDSEFLFFNGFGDSFSSSYPCLTFDAENEEMRIASCNEWVSYGALPIVSTCRYRDKYYMLREDGQLNIHFHDKWIYIDRFINVAFFYELSLFLE